MERAPPDLVGVGAAFACPERLPVSLYAEETLPENEVPYEARDRVRQTGLLAEEGARGFLWPLLCVADLHASDDFVLNHDVGAQDPRRKPHLWRSR